MNDFVALASATGDTANLQKGASAQMIADQLGHSRISMTQDVYMRRRAVSPELATALESLDENQRPRPRNAEGR